MVVVAIIAILSTIAIPSYQNFQAKARQKEGFALLGAYFTAAQASRAEHGFYPGDFVASGFQPTGSLHYRVTVGANPTLVARATAAPPIYYGTYSTNCLNTSQACACLPAACAPVYTSTWQEVAIIGSSTGVAAPVLGACGAPAATDTTFNVVASGVIRTSGDADTYAMNQLKALTMCNDGIN